jgi:hypothetical protein
MFTEEWVGFDIDSTLAEYVGIFDLLKIGAPIPDMKARLLRMYAEGKYEIKIFSARAGWPGQKEVILEWLQKNGMPELAITNKKDFRMAFCFDDRSRQVIPNTGKVVGE